MKSSSRGSSSTSKKIIVYALIGILAVTAVSVSVFARPPLSGTNNQDEDLKRFQEQWCGAEANPNTSAFVTEFVLPSECEMPVGITADTGKVWYVSAKRGLLGSYNAANSDFKEYTIPEWHTRDQPFTAVPSWLMPWTAKTDVSGKVWFTDQNNAIWRFDPDSESFDKFPVPAKYPSAMDFDANGNIYFIGITSKSLYFGDVSLMRAGTSDGFVEIPLPLDGFSGINSNLITSGSLVVDNERNKVWVSLLAFQIKGQLFQYDIDTSKVVNTVNLPADLSSPVGAALDDSGNLWVADHGTSTFFKYDPAQDSITKFVTSVASPKIYGGTTPANAYTLPYWVEKGPDGSLWFNEHTGNKIARFHPEELTLAEYWIPSQNKNWAFCPSDASTCGLANAMQFTVGEDHVWFSEWTENKIARLDAGKQIPLAVSVPEQITVARGDSAEVRITIDAPSNFTGQMMVAGTFTPTGALGNSSGIFSEESVSISGGSKQVSYTFTAAENLSTGQYILMVGAGNDDVSLMKAVRVNII